MRRQRNIGREVVGTASSSVATFEALEGRRLLTAAVTAELLDGVLSVRGTTGDDGIMIGGHTVAGRIYVGSQHGVHYFDAAAVTAIVVDAGAGDDVINIFNHGLNLTAPVTLIGGTGDDTLTGQGGTASVGGLVEPGVTITLVGGDGEDELVAGMVGRTVMIGGAGEDVYGHSDDEQIVDDQDVTVPEPEKHTGSVTDPVAEEEGPVTKETARVVGEDELEAPVTLVAVVPPAGPVMGGGAGGYFSQVRVEEVWD